MLNPYMKLALAQAHKAFERHEVPVGAVVVHNNKVIATGYNLRETNQSATAHAEIVAIEHACRAMKSWHLEHCDLYVTLEPCVMCAGAIINARIRSLYFGAFDPKAGACGSVTDVFRLKLNHQVTVYEGIMEDECAALLQDFFKQKRCVK